MLKRKPPGLSVFGSVMFALVFLIVACPFLPGSFPLKCALFHLSWFRNSDCYFDLRTTQSGVRKAGWSSLWGLEEWEPRRLVYISGRRAGLALSLGWWSGSSECRGLGTLNGMQRIRKQSSSAVAPVLSSAHLPHHCIDGDAELP